MTLFYSVIYSIIIFYLFSRGTHTKQKKNDPKIITQSSWMHSRALQCTVVRPVVQNSTNVADPGSASGGTLQCMQFLPFFIYFSYLSYLGHLSLLGLQTKTRRQRNSSTFCSFKSYNPETFMSSAATALISYNHAFQIICDRIWENPPYGIFSEN